LNLSVYPKKLKNKIDVNFQIILIEMIRKFDYIESSYPNGVKKYKIENTKEVQKKCYYYHNNGKLSFEGVCTDINNLTKGKSYDYDGNIKYDGYLKNNTANGEGIMYHNGKKLYKGRWINNKLNGYGISYNIINGDIDYEGYWKNFFPTPKINENKNIEVQLKIGEDDKCCICMDKKFDIQTDCKHYNFCLDCLQEHYKDNQTCPICRHNFKSVDIIKTIFSEEETKIDEEYDTENEKNDVKIQN